MVDHLSRTKSNRFSCAVVGKPGVGKTSLIKTIYGYEFDERNRKWNKTNKSDERVCILSADRDNVALDDLYDDSDISVEGFQINSFKDFTEIYNFFLHSDEAKEKYNWIFIDSGTEIAEYCDNVMKEKYESNNYKRWDMFYQAFIDTLRNFKNMEPYNVVITFLEEVDKDINNIRYIDVLVPGNKVGPKIRAMFDELFYMVNIKDADGINKTGCLTHPYNEYPAKDHSGKLDLWEEPNLLKIRNKIKSISI